MGEFNLNKYKTIVKTLLLTFFISAVSFSVNAGCDTDMADADLQVASGLNEDQIRNLILAAASVDERKEVAATK